MIKLVNVNKYFNRFKSNQIHVINNTTLDLPETGLVALLGESGCGKTTLLNAIGGLDNINNGSIFVNGKKMPRGTTYAKDKLRTLNIGYIFQNFNLLDNMTVFDNIAISLKMIGIKNKKEIENRVYYVLEKTNMYRFRNRLCSDLSGGQRQRVAIARALVKNPSVIIADEPTGNLDSKNTIEVMNIIKHISTSKLVILVTHEKEIAYFYASRIIKLEDGKIISNEENTDNNELNLRMDNKIYLKDYKIQDNITKDGYNFNIYTNNEVNIDLDIAIKNGNIYIRSSKNIEVVDDNSNIEFINDNYKAITKEDYEKNNFDLSILDNSKNKIKYSSIYNLFGGLALGFKKVKLYSVLKKILLIGFVFSVMFIFYALSNIFGILNIDDTQFVEYNKNYYSITSSKKNVELYNKLNSFESVDYVLPGDSSINFSFVSELYQFKYYSPTYKASLASTTMINKKDLIEGRLPESNFEVILDKFIYETYKDNMTNPINQYNVLKYEDLMDKTIKLGNDKYKVVGITDLNSPSIYVNNSEFIKILYYNPAETTYYDGIQSENSTYKYFQEGNITIKKGRLPENDYEVIINYSNYNEYDDTYKIGKELNDKINDRKLVLVGFYESNKNENTYYVNQNMINVLNISNLKNFTVYPKDEKAFINEIKDMDIKYNNTYDASKSKFKKQQLKQTRSSIIIACVLLGISFLEIYLMIRSSFISRIKEVGTMRAIGVKKIDIYKMFSNEIIAISIISSIPGIWLMYNILKSIADLEFFKNNYMLNFRVAILSCIVFLIFNLIVGLIPVWATIRKSPANILSRNDVD